MEFGRARYAVKIWRVQVYELALTRSSGFYLAKTVATIVQIMRKAERSIRVSKYSSPRTDNSGLTQASVLRRLQAIKQILSSTTPLYAPKANRTLREAVE